MDLYLMKLTVDFVIIISTAIIITLFHKMDS